MNSNQDPRIPWPIVKCGTVRELKWQVTLGKNESGTLNFASKNNRNIVLSTEMQDPVS